MTVREIIAALEKLSEDAKDLPAYAICGSSGTNYELSTYGSIVVAGRSDDAGPLCDLEGQEYIRFSLG